jgi:cysteine desulfurase
VAKFDFCAGELKGLSAVNAGPARNVNHCFTRGIYLDNNATTPVLPEVLAAMLPFFREVSGNPSSAHTPGAEARSAIEVARDQVAHLVGSSPSNVLFTSSATEAINTAFHSALALRNGKSPRIITTAVEHPAVQQCALAAQDNDVKIIELPVDGSGAISLDQLTKSLRDNICLVSVMWANNESGVIFPIREIASLCSDVGVPLHVDAVQAAGKLAIDLEDLSISYLSISSHKIFGPKGVGALVAPPPLIKPLIRGGGQEAGRRGGTENVPAIVGFGEAARIAIIELRSRVEKSGSLRNRLERVIFQNVDGCYINGAEQPRIANTSNLGFDHIDGDALAGMLNAAGIHVSTGSACSTETIAPSHVVMAMTGSYRRASEAVRFSLSHLNTDDEIDKTIAVVEEAVLSLRGGSAP